MTEIRARKVMNEVVQRNARANKNLAIMNSDLFELFKNKKYTNQKYREILMLITSQVVPEVEKHIKEFEKNLETKSPHESLVIFLNNIAPNLKLKPKASPDVEVKPSISLKLPTSVKRSSDFESPVLSSTRISTSEVSEIREKLAQQVAQQPQQPPRIASSTPSTSYRNSLSNSNNNNTTSNPYRKSIPKSPTVTSNSTNSVWNFNFSDEILPIQTKTPENIVGIPASAQEKVLINELLYTLIGIRGNLIVSKLSTSNVDHRDHLQINNNDYTLKQQSVEFEINEQVPETIKDLLMEILPLANFFFQIQNFVNNSTTSESGQVLQALSCALKKLVNDYYTTIGNLESMHLDNKLNLHKLLYYLRPVFHSMETIAHSVTTLQNHNTRGGNVLTRLHDSIGLLSGDKKAQQILIYLTQLSAEPYMEILKLWIYKGVICDHLHEFFIEDNKKAFKPDENDNYSDNYWEKRYVICVDKIPRFLEKQADIILRTGKYLNVIRECGKVLPNRETSSLKFSHTDENYISVINDAYQVASKSLLELIMEDNDLMGRLQSVKRYFLLQQGDFIAQFMDACEQELAKNVDDVIPMRLENLLELTLRLSSAKYDKYQDDLCTTLLPFSVVTQIAKILKGDTEDEYLDDLDTSDLIGIECFAFDYKVQWPVSIVLNHMTISKYQLIFRQLYYCKHVERLLCRVWIANNNAKKFAPATAELYRSAFTLRQRMMNAIQNLEYYMMVEVIEPNWHEFIVKMEKDNINIDDVLRCHEDFLDQCLKNCFLTSPDLLKTIIQLCNICIDFCNFIEQGESSLAPSETFSQKVNRFDIDFTGKLIGLLNKINEVAGQSPSDKFINLIHRINFNSYYTDKLEFLYSKDTNQF